MSSGLVAGTGMAWLSFLRISVSPSVMIPITMPPLAFTLFNIRQDLVVHTVLSCEHHDGKVFIDKRDRTMLHFSRGISLRMDVRNLLQFQRPFKRHRKIGTPAEIEKIARLEVVPGDHLDSGIFFETAFRERRNVNEVGKPLFYLIQRQASATRREKEAE